MKVSKSVKGRGGKHHAFKMKEESVRSCNPQQMSFSKGHGFREGPELYTKIMERLGLYASTQF